MSFLKMFLFLFIFLILSLISPFSKVSAQICGSARTIVTYFCDANCNPVTGPLDYECTTAPGYCAGWVNGTTCQSVGGKCNELGGYVYIPCGGTPPGGGGGCDTSAPDITNIVWNTPSGGLTVYWNKGAGDNKHTLLVGTSKEAVQGNCLGVYEPNCLVINTDATSPYQITNRSSLGFVDGNYYWFRVVNVDGACSLDDAVESKAIAPVCTLGTPTWISIIPSTSDATRATFNWNPGSPELLGTTQRFYVDDVYSKVSSNCPVAGDCNIQLTGWSRLRDTYTSVSGGLSLGTKYFSKIVNYQNATCSTSSIIKSFITPCGITVSPINQTINAGGSQIYTASVTSNIKPTRVYFSSSNSSAGDFTAGSALTTGTGPYSAQLTFNASSPTSKQTTTISVDVISGTINCHAETPLAVNAAPVVVTYNPWWQAKDGDITAKTSISSNIPSVVPVANKYLILKGLGGYVGVPVYGNSLSAGSGDISFKKWNAKTQTFLSREFDYAYFEDLIPDDITFNDISKLATGSDINGSAVLYNGYEWYMVNNTFNINTSNINFTNRKVILFVNGDLNISKSITKTTGSSGFFGVFVKNNINVNVSLASTTVASLEGIYLTDGMFSTGGDGTTTTGRLWIRGTVAAHGGFSLKRNLGTGATGNESNSSTLFEFAPDQILEFPSDLSYVRTKWEEVNP